MDHEVGPWKMAIFHGSSSWYVFLKKNYIKSLGSSLGVNWMWTKRNDHAPKSNVLIFFKSPIREILKIKIKFDHSLVFSCLHLLFPINNFIKFSILITFLYHKSCLFLHEHLFCLSHCKTCWIMLEDNVGLEICLLGTLNSVITLTFFSLV